MEKEQLQKILANHKNWLFGKEGKKADNSAIVAINYYGNTAKEDYSFYITSDYLAFQNYYTHFDIWIDDIFSIELYDSGLHIYTKIENKTSMFKILNTQVGK